MLREVSNGAFRWIDVERPSRDEMKELGERFWFHELNLEDCLSKIQIPKIDRYPDHVFVILRFPVMERELVPRSSQLAAFMWAGYLVTVHQGDLKPVGDIFRKCSEDAAGRQELMGHSAGYLLHTLVDSLTDGLLDLVRKIVGNIDDIEDMVFDESVAAAEQISYIRRQITSLRRLATPLRRTVVELAARDVARFSEEDLTDYYDDIKDHIDKVIETLDESKETIEIFKDTDFMHGTEKSNRILAVLTIIFTLSMPVTILSSLYGMNVDLPTVEAGRFLGRYTTFILIVIASAATALGMSAYFRRLRWI